MSFLDLMKIMSDPEAQAEIRDQLTYYAVAFKILLERQGITDAEIRARISDERKVKNGEVSQV